MTGDRVVLHVCVSMFMWRGQYVSILCICNFVCFNLLSDDNRFYVILIFSLAFSHMLCNMTIYTTDILIHVQLNELYEDILEENVQPLDGITHHCAIEDKAIKNIYCTTVKCCTFCNPTSFSTFTIGKCKKCITVVSCHFFNHVDRHSCRFHFIFLEKYLIYICIQFKC